MFGATTFIQSETSCCKYISYLRKEHKPPFTKNFLNGIKSLPKEYNEEAYLDFLLAFGTHYIEKATLGAVYGEMSSLDIDDYNKVKDSRRAATYAGFDTKYRNFMMTILTNLEPR